VECALKACVAKQVKQYDFPDKKLANDAFTHDLERLMRVAGLTPELEEEIKADPSFKLKWTLVKDWTESARYDDAISAAQAKDLFAACAADDGMLPWVKKRW
jgi:hypothetical protein